MIYKSYGSNKGFCCYSCKKPAVVFILREDMMSFERSIYCYECVKKNEENYHYTSGYLVAYVMRNMGRNNNLAIRYCEHDRYRRRTFTSLLKMIEDGMWPETQIRYLDSSGDTYPVKPIT